MNKPRTEAELKLEWDYVYDERLAMLGCYGVPNHEQDKMAMDDADQAVAKLRKEQEL